MEPNLLFKYLIRCQYSKHEFFFYLTGLSRPLIKANSGLVESDVVIDAGSQLLLTCEGDQPVMWVPRLKKHKRHIKNTGNKCTFMVASATAEFTGTYKCVYIGKETSNFSSVHVFVRGETMCGAEK